jgi:phytoene desaturase
MKGDILRTVNMVESASEPGLAKKPPFYKPLPTNKAQGAESMKKHRIVVIGAGLGGLSAAIRLSAAGHEVTVVEKEAAAGGKAGTLTLGAYRFDTGPSLITMEKVFDQLYQEAGAIREDKLPFRRLETVCSYFFPDGRRLDAPGTPEALDREVSRVLGEDPGEVERYLRYSRSIYRKSAPLFLYRSLHELKSWFDPEVIRSLTGKGDLDVKRTMDEANRAFFRDPSTVQLFNRYATYNGSSPYQVPATLNIIPWVEYGLGAFGSPGGIIAISRSMEELARSSGVRFLFNTPAQFIKWETRGKKRLVKGVQTPSDLLPADIVVSNADVRHTYRQLLKDPDAPMALRYDRLEPSSSALVFFWGINRSFPELKLNNIFFSDDYPSEFSSLFSKLQVPGDPTVYINITSKINPADAPPGHENWFVLVNAPRNSNQNWAEETKRTRKAVLSRLEKILGVDIAPHIAEESVLDPERIEKQSGSMYGSLYGISSNTKTAAFLRHRNRSRRYRGLYFAGGSAHPGGGMPLAILSGKIVSDLIIRRKGRL